jgi:hypothetical protein
MYLCYINYFCLCSGLALNVLVAELYHATLHNNYSL